MSIKNLVFSSLIITGFMMISSCKNNELCITGEGTPITTTLSISEFDGIDLAISSNVTITQGATQEVKATGHQNVIDNISKDISNNIWVIEFKEGCFKNYELSFQITVPDINKLNISGSGDILVNDFSGQGSLDVDLGGSGQLTLNEFESTTSLSVDMSGSGDFIANKEITTLENLNVNISGSADYLGFNLSSENCTVGVFGSGNVELTATNTLDVSIDGSGDVSYKGSPTITQDISGSGKLKDAN